MGYSEMPDDFDYMSFFEKVSLRFKDSQECPDRAGSSTNKQTYK